MFYWCAATGWYDTFITVVIMSSDMSTDSVPVTELIPKGHIHTPEHCLQKKYGVSVVQNYLLSPNLWQWKWLYWATYKGLRYKLRTMGVPMSGPSYLFGDNQSAISNTTAPETQLKKKSNSIAYHWVCESVASGELYEKKRQWFYSFLLPCFGLSRSYWREGIPHWHNMGTS